MTDSEVVKAAMTLVLGALQGAATHDYINQNLNIEHSVDDAEAIRLKILEGRQMLADIWGMR